MCGCLAGALEMCGLEDLEEIGMSKPDAQRILSHFGAVGGADTVLERCLDALSSEPAAAVLEDEVVEEEEEEAEEKEEKVDESEKVKVATMKTFAEKIAPLAEKVTEYIIDHQDDAAQEDRWRTIMKRDMTKSFKKLEKEMQRQREEMQRQRKEMQGREGNAHEGSMGKSFRKEEMQSIDEKLDRIVKDLGRITPV